MSFNQMKRDELYELATENFAVEVSETATKQSIIAALAENGVTWEMAKVYDPNAAAIAAAEEESAPEPEAAGVITSASTKPEPTVVSVDPVVEETADEVDVTDEYVLVPRGVDGYVKNNVFYPAEPAGLGGVPSQASVNAAAAGVVLIKMERENPSYQVRGYKFTRTNPFVLVKDADADFVLSHEQGFRIASPREAKEYYG